MVYAFAPSKGVEKVNKIVGSIVSIILVLSFAMGIYCAGTNKTYDFKKHLESISSVGEEMPHFEELGSIWEADIVENGKMGAGPAGQIRKTIHLIRWPSVGAFKAVTGENGAVWYPFVKAGRLGGTDDANEFWEPVSNFIDGIYEFTGRMGYTLIWLGNYVVSFFNMVFALSPTSGIVERGAI